MSSDIYLLHFFAIKIFTFESLSCSSQLWVKDKVYKELIRQVEIPSEKFRNNHQLFLETAVPMHHFRYRKMAIRIGLIFIINIDFENSNRFHLLFTDYSGMSELSCKRFTDRRFAKANNRIFVGAISMKTFRQLSTVSHRRGFKYSTFLQIITEAHNNFFYVVFVTISNFDQKPSVWNLFKMKRKTRSSIKLNIK